MDLFPWDIVSNGDAGVQDKTPLFGRGAEVHNMAAENHGVRYRDVDILDRPDACDKERLLDHVAGGIGDLHAVTNPEGSHVGQHDTGHDIGSGRRRSQRKQHTDEHRNTLEEGGIGAGEIGKDDNDSEGNDKEPDDLVGGICPFFIKTGKADCSPSHLRENKIDELDDIARDEDDHKNEKQVGEVAAAHS